MDGTGDIPAPRRGQRPAKRRKTSAGQTDPPATATASSSVAASETGPTIPVAQLHDVVSKITSNITALVQQQLAEALNLPGLAATSNADTATMTAPTPLATRSISTPTTSSTVTTHTVTSSTGGLPATALTAQPDLMPTPSPSYAGLLGRSHSTLAGDSSYTGTVAESSAFLSTFSSPVLPLHISVPPKTKEKIWNLEYVDLATIFDEENTGRISLSFDGQGVASVQSSPRKRFLTIEQWTDAFAKYSSVLLLKYPESGESLSQYSQTVRSIARSNGNWYNYDTAFRKLKQSVAIPWNVIQHELYFKALNNKQQLFRSQSTKNKKTCHKYNRGEHCAGCNYEHSCATCGKKHPQFRCWKQKGANSAPVATSQDQPTGKHASASQK